MRTDGTGPDPRSLAAGEFAADREGKVLEVILTGATEGTNEAILAYLQANPPEGYRGQIREPTVRYFTKSALEAGIIEARLVGGKTVYLPLENGPPFAMATPEGLDFRRRVLATATAAVPVSRESRAVLRAYVRELMTRLAATGLGKAVFEEKRDRFRLNLVLTGAARLTLRPGSHSFVRSEDGSLLFRAPTQELIEKATPIAPAALRENSVKGLEYRWSGLDRAVLDRLFAAVAEIGGAGGLSTTESAPATRMLVSRVDCDEVGPGQREWVINDANHRHFHGVVRLSESPLALRLSWRATPESPEVLLGCFRLDLTRLLEDGYARLERDEDRSEIRLRFYRGDNGVVFVQTHSDAPALPIAWLEPGALSSQAP
jgi:hypothetical protein